MSTIKNVIKAMESRMDKATVHKARVMADQEIFKIHLADLREQMHMKQSDIPSFTQTAVSKLEKRKDMKLSTLIEYLEGIGMGLEIIVYPKNRKNNIKKATLLKI